MVHMLKRRLLEDTFEILRSEMQAHQCDVNLIEQVRENKPELEVSTTLLPDSSVKLRNQDLQTAFI